ncbi:TRI15 [Apiospora marii]|uniref:TRI15 n=1 Tax=Apiospora marii TaxID=335849 RepID=A0ABR1S7T0_9PEZI
MDATTGGSSSNDGSTMPKLGGEQYDRPQFIPECCLFCNEQLADIESNRLHMQTAHGLFIPSRDRLLVDVETLFDYLHLVIFGYSECISCGTRRNTPSAAQQHMTGKNHCRFDISAEGSEFADFYDFSDSESDSAGDATGQAMQTCDNSMRLPSGKVITSRPDNTSGLPRQRRNPRQAEASLLPEDPGTSNDSGTQRRPKSTTSLVEASGSSRNTALTRSEKRENAFTTQLANMRAGDRQALAHLPLPQQRSIMATSLKQLKKARQLERKYQIATERSGNKTLMGRFVPDGPIRPNG